MKGFPCEDSSCELNIRGTCTAEPIDGCEVYAIGDEGEYEDFEEEQP